MVHGWVQVAFERELSGDLAEAWVGDRKLLLARTGAGIQAFDAHCPHRGADLSRGGKLSGDAIVCPFHGRRIGLGRGGDDGFCLRGHRALSVGGLVFALFSDARDHGISSLMEELDRTHFFVPGFAVPIRTSPERVIENAFDRRHFKHVHGLARTPDLALGASRRGELVVTGRFDIPLANPWQRGVPGGASAGVDFVARVYSPTLCVSELRDADLRYVVLTAATPAPGGECLVRVSLAVPPASDGSPPSEERVRALLRDSRTSIEQDRAIWEGLSAAETFRPAPDDDLILAFHDFCRRFHGEDPSP